MMPPSANQSPLPKSRFKEVIIQKNELDKKGFLSWAFYPGMLFASRKKWWGDYGERNVPHEGLDLCYFINRQKKMVSLCIDTKIPVIYDGIVVKLMGDYLGKSIVIRHGLKNSLNQVLVTILGHTVPNDNLRIGEKVYAGDCIATLSDTHRSPSGLPPHLHLSVGWISESLSYDQLDWETIADPEIITLSDPMEMIFTESEVFHLPVMG